MISGTGLDTHALRLIEEIQAIRIRVFRYFVEVSDILPDPEDWLGRVRHLHTGIYHSGANTSNIAPL